MEGLAMEGGGVALADDGRNNEKKPGMIFFFLFSLDYGERLHSRFVLREPWLRV